MYVVLKDFPLALYKGVGEGEAGRVLGQVRDAFGLGVGNSLESSCIRKMWWHLLVSYFFR